MCFGCIVFRRLQYHAWKQNILPSIVLDRAYLSIKRNLSMNINAMQQAILTVW